jgi:glucosylglycerate synthase
METHSIPGQVQERTEGIDNADLVVGILAEFDPDGFTALCDALRTLSGSPRIAVLRNNRIGISSRTNGTEGSGSLFFVPLQLTKPDTADQNVLSMFAAYQAVFSAGERLGAQACCVVASKLESATPQLVCQLAQPLLERDLDLVVPHYAPHKFEGLLNNSIISPLTRCLYGKRICNPMGPDLGVSKRLFQRMLGTGPTERERSVHPLASLAPQALCNNMKVCELYVGARTYPPTDWQNLSSLIAQVLGPVFLDMEQNAGCWQRVRGSISVPTIGDPAFVSRDTGSVDISRMVESFQLGNRELQEIWGLVLPPATLFELRKLLRSSPEQFHMPDELWVRIIYDFALAHHLRTISRDHLLKSMTPLYLGWVASYAIELQSVGVPTIEQRLERMSLAYEASKPYLVSRWRWPDRFSP